MVLRQLLFDVLEKEDDCIEILMIIENVRTNKIIVPLSIISVKCFKVTGYLRESIFCQKNFKAKLNMTSPPSFKKNISNLETRVSYQQERFFKLNSITRQSAMSQLKFVTASFCVLCMEKNKKGKSPWLKTKKKTGPRKKKKRKDGEKLLPKPHKRIAHKPRYNNECIDLIFSDFFLPGILKGNPRNSDW